MILLDTSVLVRCLTGSRLSLPTLERVIEEGERVGLCTIVLYEWLRGPRRAEELGVQEALFPTESAIPFEAADAELTAKLYRSVKRARGREADLAIAACTVRQQAQLWTLNIEDFADVPGLRLLRP